MNALTSTPGAARLFALSLVARLPMAMLSIGLLVHTELATGAYAAAGLVAGAFALAQGIGGPLLGRLVDRRGQTLVLARSAVASACALAATAALRHDAPLDPARRARARRGRAMPPVGACMRALFASLVDEAALRGAYATDAAAVELTWVAGPPIVLAVGDAVSDRRGARRGRRAARASARSPSRPPASRAAGGPSRASDAARRAARPRHADAGRRSLLAVGLVFGAVEVAVTASAEGVRRARAPPARCSACGASAR